MLRLKQYLERLRSDFHVLNLMRKDSKHDTSSHHHPDDLTLEVSNDSDKMVTDQITGTLDLINKLLDANLQQTPVDSDS